MKRYLLVLLVLSYLTLYTPIIKMVIPTKNQFDELTAELLHAGLSDPRLRLAIFSLIGTEGGYNLAEESSYRKTTASRLRTIFGKRLAHLTDEQLDTLKKDDLAFYDTVYGNRYGNTNPGDGFKYRGRGYNQLTFKDGYRKYSNAAGVDLVANPEKMNDPKIAMRVLGAYFKEGIKAGEKMGLLRRKFGVTDISQLTTQEQFNRLVCQINAGWGTKISGGIFDAKNQKMDQNAEAIAAKYMNA
jgi:predicted chitinase